MNNEDVYQSGQTIPETGWYEVVGTGSAFCRRAAKQYVRSLNRGDLFPDYDGRAGLWHKTEFAATDTASNTVSNGVAAKIASDEPQQQQTLTQNSCEASSLKIASLPLKTQLNKPSHRTQENETYY